jgi:hypothetical protein
LGPIDRLRGGIIRAVVGLGKPLEAVAVSRGAIVHRRIKAPTLLAAARHRGTDSSNPLPSSGESANHPSLSVPGWTVSGNRATVSVCFAPEEDSTAFAVDAIDRAETPILAVMLSPDANFYGLEKRGFGDIKPGDFVASGACAGNGQW